MLLNVEEGDLRRGPRRQSLGRGRTAADLLGVRWRRCCRHQSRAAPAVSTRIALLALLVFPQRVQDPENAHDQYDAKYKQKHHQIYVHAEPIRDIKVHLKIPATF